MTSSPGELHAINARYMARQRLEDLRSGQVAYLIYLANRDSSKGGEPLTLQHFMPTEPVPEPVGQSVGDIVAAFEALAKGMNCENH